MKPHEQVIMEVARERERQISFKGHSPERDDAYTGGELALAGAGYAAFSTKPNAEMDVNIQSAGKSLHVGWAPLWYLIWPWSRPPKGTQRERLIKAAALIVAEIERLDRAVRS